jgi:NAD(P)H-hydrate epimerase
MQTLNRHWIRELDRRAIEEYGIPGLVLMENAARGAVDVLMSLGCRGPVALACGRGNNAGDGFAMARHLDLRGIAVRVLVAGDPTGLRGDAATNYAILEKCRISTSLITESTPTEWIEQSLAGCEWIVDALLGTGASGEPRPPLDGIIQAMNRSPAKRLAVDLPSGLDCDTGQAAATTIRADHTVTFVAAKPGLIQPEAAEFVGQWHIADIGAPRVLVEEIVREAMKEMTNRANDQCPMTE